MGLRQQMLEKRISIRVLAEKAGVSTSTVHKAMEGKNVDDFLLSCITEAVEIMPVQKGHHHTGKTPCQKWKLNRGKYDKENRRTCPSCKA